MKLSTFSLSLLVLSYCSVVHGQETVKEGHCPLIIPDYEATCLRECSTDDDCTTDTHRCCQNACGGTHCVEPLSQEPCDEHECEHVGEVCSNQGTHSVCLCGDMCPQNYEPICGQLDGDEAPEEFGNRCYMTLKMCELQKAIEEVDCEKLAEKLGKVDGDGATKDDITGLHEKLDTLLQDSKGMNSKLDAMQGRLDNIEEDINDIRQQVQEESARISNLESIFVLY